MIKLLVVEDDREIRSMLKEILDNAGYTTLQAQDGRQAIDILEQEIPDLVISDIMMPNVDGYQVLEFFQKLPAAATVPFIFLTAKTDGSDLRKGMNYGADDYITKPFRVKELLQSVETHLRKKEKIEKKFEDIFFDISAYVPHELRTPLIPIIGYSQLIKEQIDTLTKEEIIDMVTRVESSSRRLHKTVEKFIRYTGSRLGLALKDSNIIPAKEYITSSNNILERVCRKMAEDARREKDLKLELEDASIKISKEDFEFIIGELLENAIKFSNIFSKIMVKSYVIDDKFFLQITDYGRGISREQLTDIMPFGQHERNKYQQAGNGLGLISTKNLVQLYGGELKLASEVNKYTTCTVSLPLN